MASAAIDVEGLWQSYRPKTRNGWRRRGRPFWALRDVTVTVDHGEMVGVVGGNGSGKTTLLQSAAGVLRPVRGTIRTSGRVSSLVDLSAGMHRELTGHENLVVAGLLQGLTRRQIRERYGEIVEFCGLSEEALDAPARTYSAGMGLRLGFSIVVATRPDVLLVDEVLAVGDESFQNRCIGRVRELKDDGCGILLVSHDLDLLREHCDRVVVLIDGTVRFAGEAGEAVDRYIELSGGTPDEQDLSATAVYRASRGYRRRRVI